MTEWFRRKTAKITTFDKKDIEEGKWQKCSNCGEVLYSGILIEPIIIFLIPTKSLTILSINAYFAYDILLLLNSTERLF